MPRRRLLTLLVAGSALLAGCGAGSHSGSTAATAPYVAQANRVCAAQLAQLNKLKRPTSPEQAIAYLPHVIAIMHSETTKLATLDPQGAPQSELAAALKTDGKLSALLSRFLHQLKTGIVELTTFSQVQTESNALRQQLDAHFRRAGLSSCVQ